MGNEGLAWAEAWVRETALGFSSKLNVDGHTLGVSFALGVAGLAVGVPYVPGLTDNVVVGLVGAAAPIFNQHKVGSGYVPLPQ